jgi:hypothetical protein
MNEPVTTDCPPTNVIAALAANVISFDCSNAGVVSLQNRLDLAVGNAYTWFVTRTTGTPNGIESVGIAIPLRT